MILCVIALVASHAQTGSGKKQRRTPPSSSDKDSSAREAAPEEGLVQVPKNIDHRIWDDLLKKYVDDRGLVDYAAWKASSDDIAALNRYLDQFSRGQPFATGNDRFASLINLYNAATIQWMLKHYPVESIWETDKPFKGKRHLAGGQSVSLDDIEHETLRPAAGYRVHAVLVCAARSCPPLAREAFRGDILDKQLDERMRAWLARDDLNKFDPQSGRAEVSSVFKFFGEDFGNERGLPSILAKYAPPDDQPFLRSGKAKISYLPYHWGLNDQSERGKKYKRGVLKKLFR